MKKFLLTLLGVLIALPAFARIFTYTYEGQTLTYTVINEDARTCTTCEGYMIGESAYPGNSVRGKLTIPSVVKDGDTEYSVTEIGYLAFGNCTGLTQLTIPNSVKSIGQEAFSGCTGLTSVIIPNSVTEIGYLAFYGCTGLTRVTIPNSVTSIRESAFEGCTHLTKVEFESIEALCAIWFESQYANPLSYARHLYIGGKEVTEIVIPESVIAIGKYAFYGCTGLTKVTIPNSVTYIGGSAFSGCTGLTQVTIPNSVTSIGGSAFEGCTGLTQVTIPNSVTSIGGSAFEGCIGLTQVTIPNSVTSIGGSAFEGCTGLTDITVEATTPVSINSNTFDGLYDTATLTIPEGSFDAYISSNWGKFKKIKFADSSEICDYKTFDDGVLTYRLNTLGKTAVVTGSNTSVITIPDCFTDDSDPDNPVRYSVMGIGAEAFTGKTIDSFAFNSRSKLEYIGEYAFYGSTLSAISLPETVKTIGASAFKGCSKLTSVIIPCSVKSIGGNAFEYCSGLKKSAYPKTLRNPFPSGIRIAYNPDEVVIENGVIFGPDKTSIIFAPMSLSGEYMIPETVTSIESQAFGYCSELTSVVIPNSVKSISSNAFQYCSSLTNITVESSSPASIKADSFNGLYDTATLTIPEGSFDAYASSPTWGQFKKIKFANSSEICDYKTFDDGVLTYRLNTIGKTAIVTGANTSVITIPERFTDDSDPANPVRYYVTAIGAEAFKEKTIESFAFNSRSKLEYIGEYAFYGSTLSAISLPETVKIIGASAFERCSNLTSMTIPNSVESIGMRAFERCSGLTQMTIPNSVKSIDKYAFYACPNLTQVNIGNSVTFIGSEAFYNCSSLTKAEFASIEALCAIEFEDAYANPLYYAHHLYIGGAEVTEVVIPESVKAIGSYAFSGCSSLTKAEFASIEALCAIEFGNASANPLYYARHLYIGGKEVTEVVIPESVTAIGNYTFWNCSGLTQVTIPKSVTSIGRSAFRNCSRLTQVTIPNYVTSIGNYAFSDCTGLTQVTIPNSVESIGSQTFNGCTGLTQVTIGNSVESIGSQTFNGCTGLTQVTIGNSVESIGSQAFNSCTGLTQVTIPNSVTYIGEKAFDNCTGLTSITMVDGKEPIDIASDAFSAKPTSLYWGRPFESLNIDYSEVTDLTIGNCTEEIPAGQFKNHSKLTKLTLGSSLTAIGDGAFSGCSELAEVIVPPAVESIGAEAFAGNSKLASIILGSNLKTIGDKAFDGCPASTVSITAKTPPTAPNTTFSNYSGKLYLVDKAAADAYYDAYTCWDRFNSYVMVTPERMEGGQTEIKGVAGEQIQLTATLWPENVTLPQVFWRSTNPEVATVDENGLVTLHVDINRSRSIDDGCKIIAESLYGTQLEFNVLDPGAGILVVTVDGGGTGAGAVDYSAPYKIYNLNGVELGGTLDSRAPGIYIIRQGNAVEKKIVR